MHRVALAVLVLTSWLARVSLAVTAGRFYGPDEVRYCRPVELLYLLSRGELSSFYAAFVGRVDHPLYRLAGLAPPAAQRLYAYLLGYESSAATMLRTMWVAASVFAPPVVPLTSAERGLMEDLKIILIDRGSAPAPRS